MPPPASAEPKEQPVLETKAEDVPTPVPAAVAEAPPPAEAKAHPPVIETVSYRLAIKPWGTVYVDGRERGVSPPMKKLLLPAGRHKLRIVNPSFPDYYVNLDPGKNRTGTIEHDFASARK
jgi:hypothetical protein